MNEVSNELAQLTEGVWLATEPVRIVGMRLTATMTVIALPGSGLLLHSPIPLTPTRRAAVEALGTVTHLYAPNTFHHAWIGQWARAFPDAKVHAPRALRAKRPDLVVARDHDHERDRELDDVFDEIHIDGFRLEESVLVHRVSGTLVVADLVHNIGRPTDPWTRLYSSAMGFHDRVALSRAIRWTGFADRAAARRSVDTLAACTFDRLVVGHGSPLDRGAKDAVLDAYTWLRGTGTPLALPAPSAPTRGSCG